MVRVESHDRRRIQRVLDMGAEGILVPRIATLAAEQGIATEAEFYEALAKMASDDKEPAKAASKDGDVL